MSHPDTRPVIAISMGDPGGIGPEIVAKAVCRQDVRSACHPLVVGDLRMLRETARLVDVGVVFQSAESASPIGDLHRVGVIETPSAGRAFSSGQVDADNGRAAHAWIVKAATLALEGKVDGICTAPSRRRRCTPPDSGSRTHRTPGAARGELRGPHDARRGGIHVVLETIHESIAAFPRCSAVNPSCKPSKSSTTGDRTT